MKYVIKPLVSMRNLNDQNSLQTNQCMFGEKIKIINTDNRWSYVQVLSDGYNGWIKNDTIGNLYNPTHRVIKNNTLMYMHPSNKSLSIGILPLGSQIKVKSTDNVWSEFFFKSKDKDTIAFIFNSNIVDINHKTDDWVAIAETFLGTPYLWGGKSFLGIDCSGLVQISLQSALIQFPRDTGLQVKAVKYCTTEKNIKRGSLIFWEDHVGIMINKKTLLHANGFHMKVKLEDLNIVKNRIGQDIKRVLNI